MRQFFALRAALLAAFLVLGWSSASHAYPWMIRHDYTGCATCHTDPSGGFLLTQYGRAQTQTLLSTFGRVGEGQEATGVSKFAFGVDLPDWLNLGMTQRNLLMWQKPSSAPATTEHIWMQSDARMAINVGAFEAAGSLGYAHEGALAASITSRPKDNLVSREFWVGYSLDEDHNKRIRVGRMYLPFGIRVLDHYFFVRNATQTDLDSQQQYGAAYFQQSDNFRWEVMAIAGNYQLRPDKYRQRGYAGYFEYNLAQRLGLGFSSQLTYQGLSTNPGISGAALRGAHGPFVRWAPIGSVAILSEWDLLHEGPTKGGDPILGAAGFVQADWEFYPGVHAVVTPELRVTDFSAGSDGIGYRGWLTAAWFPFPHVDVRADLVEANEVLGPTKVRYTMLLGQLHISI